jgi:hypothetical protein
MTVPAADVAQGITQIAGELRATVLVLGARAGRAAGGPWGGVPGAQGRSLEQRLLADTGDLAPMSSPRSSAPRQGSARPFPGFRPAAWPSPACCSRA